MEHDENWVPRSREALGVPEEEKATAMDYEELFGEAPLFILGRLICMQILGWPAYLVENTLGNPSYPPWTNVRFTGNLFQLFTANVNVIS